MQVLSQQLFLFVFNFFLLIYLLTPYLVVARQPCMAWVPIKKKKKKKKMPMKFASGLSQIWLIYLQSLVHLLINFFFENSLKFHFVWLWYPIIMENFKRISPLPPISRYLIRMFCFVFYLTVRSHWHWIYYSSLLKKQDHN